MNGSVPYIMGSKGDSGSDREQKVKKYRRRRIYVLNIGRIVLFGISIVLLLSALTVFVLFRNLTEYRIGAKTYYYLQLEETEDGTQATAIASDFVERGAAGYIINNGNFKIMANVYSVREDAETVYSRYSGTYKHAMIYEVKIAALNLKKYFPKEKVAKIYEIYKYCIDLFEHLRMLDYSLDRGELSQAAVLKSVSDKKTELKNKKAELATLSKEQEKSKSLDLIMDFINNITGITDKNFAPDNYVVANKLKLTLCQLCMLYKETVEIFHNL